MRTSLIALVLVVTVAAPSFAQTAGDQAKPPQPPQKPAPTQTTKPKPKPVPKLPVGFRGFVAFESTSMSASTTFKAQTGSSSVIGFGGGGEILNIWRKLFVRVGFAKGRAEGNRGFVTDQGFVSTGVPLDIGVRNIEVAAGWRSYVGKQRRIALYGAGGALLTSISQESPGATAAENSSEGATGFLVLAGMEYTFWKYLVAGVEGQFRSVKGLLGTEGSVSGEFGEDNAGGASLRVLIGFRFRR